MSARPCRKDDPRWPFLCSCDDCASAAAGAWTALVDRVHAGDITLAEAQTIDDTRRSS